MSLHPLLKQQFEDARRDGGHARPAQAVARDQQRVRRMGRGTPRRRAFDAAARRRDERLHARSPRKRRGTAAGDPRPRQGRDPDRRRNRSHRNPEHDRRTCLRLRRERRPRQEARPADPLAHAASRASSNRSRNSPSRSRTPRPTSRRARPRGATRTDVLFDAEIGVSKVRLDRREVFIVCLRQTTDRKVGRGGHPRKRGPLPHAGRERARGDRRARHGRRPASSSATKTPCAFSR